MSKVPDLKANRLALIHAIRYCYNNTAEEIKEWLRAGVKIDEQDEREDTAINWAVYRATTLLSGQTLLTAGCVSVEVVQALVESGADVNIPGWRNRPPLYWGIENIKMISRHIVYNNTIYYPFMTMTKREMKPIIALQKFFLTGDKNEFLSSIDKDDAEYVKHNFLLNEAAVMLAKNVFKIIDILFDAGADLSLIKDPDICELGDLLFKQIKEQRLLEFANTKKILGELSNGELRYSEAYTFMNNEDSGPAGIVKKFLGL